MIPRDALHAALAAHPRARLFGESLALDAATRGLAAAFPGRVVSLPAADATLIGLGLGAALTGAGAIVLTCGPESLAGLVGALHSEAALVDGDFGGALVVVVPLGPGQAPGGLDGLPAVRVSVAASGPDAAALLGEALGAPGVSVLFAPRVACASANLATPAAAGRGVQVRAGSHAVVLSAGDGVAEALATAEALAAEGLSVGVADLRYLAPVDTALLAELVGASGRAVLHGVPEGLVSAVVAAAFLRLESPPLTVPLGGALAPAVRASVRF